VDLEQAVGRLEVEMSVRALGGAEGHQLGEAIGLGQLHRPEQPPAPALQPLSGDLPSEEDSQQAEVGRAVAGLQAAFHELAEVGGIGGEDAHARALAPDRAAN